MSGESNVTSGVPNYKHHHHGHLTWKKFWKVARWINPPGALVEDNVKHQQEQERQEQQAFDDAVAAENIESETPYIDTPEHRSGYKVKDVVQEGKEWYQDIDPAENAIFVIRKDHVDQFPNFWDDLKCELKGGKGCHSDKVYEAVDELLAHPDFMDAELHGDVQIKNIFKDIQHALSKGADKLDHAEDKALGIDK